MMFMKIDSAQCLLAVAVAMLAPAALLCAEEARPTEPLALQLPAPTLKGTPEDLPSGPNIEAYSDKPPTALQVPKGVKNVAAKKSVTSSVKPFTGDLEQITDEKKEAFDYDSVEMKKGAQWVQVDLGESFAIHAIAVWHDHRYIQVMHDVIVQVSDDPEFKSGVTTLYNNDTDNSSGLGVGTDREYFESKFGRVVAGKGVKARYVRGYTKGGSLSALNCWQEIEVYALPAGSKQGAGLRPRSAAARASVSPVILKSSEAGNVTSVSAAPDASSSTVQTVAQSTVANNSLSRQPLRLALAHAGAR